MRLTHLLLSYPRHVGSIPVRYAKACGSAECRASAAFNRLAILKNVEAALGTGLLAPRDGEGWGTRWSSGPRPTGPANPATTRSTRRCETSYKPSALLGRWPDAS